MHRTALITGASGGLGAYLAKTFSRAGFALHLVARRKGDLEKIKDNIRKSSDLPVQSWVSDLSSNNERCRFLQEFRACCQKLDVLINNAACQGPIGPLESNSLKDWQNTVELNLLAPVQICQELLPILKGVPSGLIINISGGGATGPRPNFTAYASSKAALVRFSETLAEEMREQGIRVNCIAPGPMTTQMLQKVLDADQKVAGEREVKQAQKVFESGIEIMEKAAQLALFLASEASVGITGKLISAPWDRWEDWPKHLAELNRSDAYTLRRITGKDRGLAWGDR